MEQLEKKLRDLEERGYETVQISQILQWIAEIKRDNQLKAFVRKGGKI